MSRKLTTCAWWWNDQTPALSSSSPPQRLLPSLSFSVVPSPPVLWPFYWSVGSAFWRFRSWRPSVYWRLQKTMLDAATALSYSTPEWRLGLTTEDNKIINQFTSKQVMWQTSLVSDVIVSISERKVSSILGLVSIFKTSYRISPS